jgi:hypothetical protein
VAVGGRVAVAVQSGLGVMLGVGVCVAVAVAVGVGVWVGVGVFVDVAVGAMVGVCGAAERTLDSVVGVLATATAVTGSSSLPSTAPIKNSITISSKKEPSRPLPRLETVSRESKFCAIEVELSEAGNGRQARFINALTTGFVRQALGHLLYCTIALFELDCRKRQR